MSKIETMTGRVSLPAVLQKWTMSLGGYKSERGGAKAGYESRERPKSSALSMPTDRVCI